LSKDELELELELLDFFSFSESISFFLSEALSFDLAFSSF